jgi:hypothetical protein
MHEIPSSISFFGTAAMAFLWAHIILACIVRFSVRHDDRAVGSLFASESSRGSIPHRSYLMRVKLFLPWISVRDASRQPMALKTLIWAARVAGTGLIVAFVLLITNFIYLASRGA